MDDVYECVTSLWTEHDSVQCKGLRTTLTSILLFSYHHQAILLDKKLSQEKWQFSMFLRTLLSSSILTKNIVTSYSLTFLLLASEMITFCAIVAPLPYAVRKRVFTFLSESPIVGKIAYGLKIAFMYVLCILFTPTKCYTPSTWSRPLNLVSLKWPFQFCSSTICRCTPAHVPNHGRGRGGKSEWFRRCAWYPSRNQLCCSQILVSFTMHISLHISNKLKLPF